MANVVVSTKHASVTIDFGSFVFKSKNFTASVTQEQWETMKKNDKWNRKMYWKHGDPPGVVESAPKPQIDTRNDKSDTPPAATAPPAARQRKPRTERPKAPGKPQPAY
jgi:hypothetical protein